MSGTAAAPEDIGNFTAETNIRGQKAYLFSISIFMLVAIEIQLLDNTATLIERFFGFGVDNINERNNEQKQNLIILIQYLFIYFSFHYTFNYIFASITYFTKYNRSKIVLSGGLFVIGKVFIDWVIPVGLTLYVLYRLNISCSSCMLGPNDQFASDLFAFLEWVPGYFDHKFAVFGNLSAMMEGFYFANIHQFVKPVLSVVSSAFATTADFLREWPLASPASDPPTPWRESPELRSYFCYDVNSLCWITDYGPATSQDPVEQRPVR